MKKLREKQEEKICILKVTLSDVFGRIRGTPHRIFCRHRQKLRGGKNISTLENGNELLSKKGDSPQRTQRKTMINKRKKTFLCALIE